MHVHVNIKLVQAAERRLCDFPECQNKADSGEGAFPPRERAHVTDAVHLLTRRLHRNGQRFIVVVKHHRATAVQLDHEVVEVQLAPYRKRLSQCFVSVLAVNHDVVETVDKLPEVPQLAGFAFVITVSLRVLPDNLLLIAVTVLLRFDFLSQACDLHINASGTLINLLALRTQLSGFGFTIPQVFLLEGQIFFHALNVVLMILEFLLQGLHGLIKFVANSFCLYLLLLLRKIFKYSANYR